MHGGELQNGRRNFRTGSNILIVLFSKLQHLYVIYFWNMLKLAKGNALKTVVQRQRLMAITCTLHIAQLDSVSLLGADSDEMEINKCIVPVILTKKCFAN